MTSWKIGDRVRRLCTAEGLEISIAWSRTDLTLPDILPGDMDHRCRTGNSRGEEQDEGNEEGKELRDSKVSTAKHPSARAKHTQTYPEHTVSFRSNIEQEPIALRQESTV